MKPKRLVSAGILSVCMLILLAATSLIASDTKQTVQAKTANIQSRQVLTADDMVIIPLAVETTLYEEAAEAEELIDVEAENIQPAVINPNLFNRDEIINSTALNKTEFATEKGLFNTTFNEINRLKVLRDITSSGEDVFETLGNSLQNRTMMSGISGISLVYVEETDKSADEGEIFLLNKEKAESSELQYNYNEEMAHSATAEDFDILCRIVEAEATGEKTVGKILVANVILNRVNSKSFPNSIEGVVFQKIGDSYQFSPTKDGRYWTVEITDSTIEAVERALSGEDYSQGALFFFERARTTAKKAAWFDSLKFILKYGCHEFFK